MAHSENGSGVYTEDTRTERQKQFDHHNQLIRVYGFDLAKAYRENDEIKRKYYQEQINEHKEKLRKLEK